jgi:hypothetical protein
MCRLVDGASPSADLTKIRGGARRAFQARSMRPHPNAKWIAAAAGMLLWSIPSAAYTLFSPEGGRFRIAAVGAPTRQPSGPGAVWSRTYLFASDRVRYAAVYADLPSGAVSGETLARALEQAQDGVVGEVSGRLRKVEAVNISGRSGRQITIDLPDGSVIVSRLVIDGDRLYQVSATTAADGAGLPEIGEVLSSFALDR